MERKWKQILEQWKDNLSRKNQLLLIFLVGILLLVVAFPVSKKDSKAEKTIQETSSARNVQTNLENYEEYLEKRLTNALESVDGVGRTEIVITLKSSGQKIVEKDQSINNQSDSNTNEAGITNSSESKSSDGTSIYERQSDGTEIPYVSKELTPEIAGVLVVADGGDNAVVVKNITDAIRALFGVEAHKIKIMKRTDTYRRFLHETNIQKEPNYYYYAGCYDCNCRIFELFRETIRRNEKWNGRDKCRYGK